MNKVFKVIWNEAKNCYVVVSELAKNRGGKSCSTRKLLAMLIATGVMCCAPLMNVAEAANDEPSALDTKYGQYVAFQASSANSSGSSAGVKYFSDGNKNYKYNLVTINNVEYWVRDGYSVTVAEIDQAEAHHPFDSSTKKYIRADVVRTGDESKAEGILTSVATVTGKTDVVTNLGETLQRVEAGSYAGVSNSSVTAVNGYDRFIVFDSSWEGVANLYQYKNGYADLYDNVHSDNKMPNGFITVDDSKLTWNETLQSYQYTNNQNKKITVDYRNMYVIDGKLGIFTDATGSNVYTGNVYGGNDEILMTVKDSNGNFHSYWAAKVTDPTQTMATFPVVEYQKNLDTLVSNDKALYHNDIKEVTLEKEVVGGVAKNDSGEIKLWRNGFTLNEDGTTSANTVVDGTIKISGGGGTGGSGADHDTFVKVGIGSNELKLNTGSKVEAVLKEGTTNKITGIKINEEQYNIDNVNISQTTDKKTTTINVGGTDYTITDTDTDTTYTAGTGISIDKNDNNKISVDTASVNLAYKANNEIGNSVSLSKGLHFVNGDNVSVTTAADGKVTISATDTNNYVTGGTYNTATKKLEFTNNDIDKNFIVDLSGITSGLSTTDYALVVNPADGSEGKYKADDDGNLKLKVKDRNGNETYEVVIEDVASAEKVAENTANITANTTNITNLTNRVSVNEINITANTTYIASLKEGLFNVGDGTKTATIKPKDTVNIVGSGAASVAVDEISKTVTINATDTKYASGKNITIDEKNGNTINLNSYLVDITSIENGTASISLTNNAGVAINGVNVNQGQTVTGLTNTDLNVEGFGTSKRAATEEQLQKVIEKAETAGAGWNLTTNSTDSSKSQVKPGETVDFTGDENITVSNVENETATNKVKVTLNNNISLSTKVNNVEGTLTINVDGNGKISGLTAGTEDNDAVNVSQLKKYVSENDSDTTYAAGKNISITGTNNEIALKNAIYFDVNDENGELKSDVLTINADNNGKISGLTAGEISATSTDAINGSQLHAVQETANKGWNLTTNSTDSSKSQVKPGETVDFTGDENITVSNVENETATNKVKVTLNNNISLSTKVNNVEGTLTINAGNSGKISGLTAGEISATSTDAINGSQLYAVQETAGKGWNLTTNGKNSAQVAPGATVDFVAVDENLLVSNIGDDGKPSTNVKFKLNKDLSGIESISNGASKIVLNNNSLAISNGNKKFDITSSGIGMSVANETGGIISSIMVTENGTTISGGLDVDGSKITNVAAGTADTDAVNYGQLKNYVSENDKNTHIKAGEYEVDSANKVNMVLVDEKGNEVDTVTITDVAKASEVGKLENVNDGIKGDTIVDSINKLNKKLDNKVGDLQYSKVEKGEIKDGDSTTTAIGKLNNKLSEVEQKAGQHTTVTAGSDNISLKEDVNSTGGKDYTIDISQNINIESVTAGDTVLNKDGVKVGNDVSLSKDGLNAGGTTVTKDGLTVGDTKVTETGLQIGDKTYVSKDGLNANDQKVTNVADGEVSATSKDAVNGSQLHATNSRIDETNQQVMNNTQNISKLGSRLNKVGAGAAALAALHPMDFDPDDKLTFAAGVGNYGGENAAAIGAYYRPDEKVMFSVGGTMGNGENMVNAGISFALDRTNHVSNSRTAMAREIVDLRAEINELKAMLAKGGLGSIDEDKLKIFPDVAENHWAYEYVGKLAAAGIVEGFPNGEFDGDRMMSRYEFAAMLYRAMQKGAQLDSRIINEFAPEMGRIRVDRISGADNDKRKIERVRVNGTDKAKNDYRDHYGSKIAK